MASTPRAFALATRYQRGLASLARRIALVVASAWGQVDGIDDRAAEQFIAAVLPYDCCVARHP